MSSHQAAAPAGSDANLAARFAQVYQDWIRRGQGGEPETVLAETAEARRTGRWAGVPGAGQRLAYCRSAVALLLDDIDRSLLEADRVVELARGESGGESSGGSSAAFEAIGYAMRCIGQQRTGRSAPAVEALARSEATVEAGLNAGGSEEWVTAQILHGVACAHLGLFDRALTFLQRPDRLAEQSGFNAVVLASNRARWRLIESLQALRTPPYRVEQAGFEAACTAAVEGGRALLPGDGPMPSIDVPLWEGLRAAWTGDPSIALDRLAPYLPRRRRVDLREMWPIAHAGRLRALGRLGRRRDLLAALAEDDEHGASRQGAHPMGGVLILLWERGRALHPELEDPGSALGRLEQARERQRSERQVALNAVLELRVEQLRGDGERQRLTEANRTDHLTGVLNRRGFEPLMHSAAHASSGPFALMMVDIDRFKTVNDTRGHVAGDETLRRLGAALAGAARVDDVVARLGGDEFAVLARLQGEDDAGAQILADRILASARHTLREWAGITVSLGCAVRARPMDSQAWLKLADGAMYSAKRAGGDRMSLVRC